MTNEEKAKEIAKETLSDLATSFLGWIDEMSEFFCKESAKRMAEWKDEQIKIVLWSHWEKLKNEHRKDAAIAVSDIIGELFPEKIENKIDYDKQRIRP